jgi:hypothetical protein
MQYRGSHTGRGSQPPEVHLETLESVTHLAAFVILSQLGNQGGAKSERRGVRYEACRSPAQDRETVGSAFLRHVADGEPVQGSAHRVMI